MCHVGPPADAWPLVYPTPPVSAARPRAARPAGYIKLKMGVEAAEGLCGIAMAASYPTKKGPNPPGEAHARSAAARAWHALKCMRACVRWLGHGALASAWHGMAWRHVMRC